MRNFPDYPSHAVVECFNCGDPLLGLDVQTNDGPSGRCSQPCSRCKMRTFYDLERDPDEAYDLKKENPKWR